MTTKRASAAQSEVVANKHYSEENWLEAAFSFMAAAVFWRQTRAWHRAELALREASRAIDRAADELAQKDFQQRERRARSAS